MRDWRKYLVFSSVGKVILQRGSRNIPLHVLMPETVIERKGYYYGSQLQGGFLLWVSASGWLFLSASCKGEKFHEKTTNEEQLSDKLLKDFKPVDVT